MVNACGIPNVSWLGLLFYYLYINLVLVLYVCGLSLGTQSCGTYQECYHSILIKLRIWKRWNRGNQDDVFLDPLHKSTIILWHALLTPRHSLHATTARMLWPTLGTHLLDDLNIMVEISFTLAHPQENKLTLQINNHEKLTTSMQTSYDIS